MKKIIIILLLLCCKVCAAKAQMVNNIITENKSVINNLTGTDNGIYQSLNYLAKDEFLQFKNSRFYNENNDLFKKGRNQKKAALIMLCGGGALVITGIIAGVNKAEKEIIGLFTPNPPAKNYTAENILLIAGGGAVLGSIPLFIVSSRNLHKARLMISNQKTNYVIPKNVDKNITGITLQISIGK
jgi:hypothetical protein